MASPSEPEQLAALVGWYQVFRQARGEEFSCGLDMADWLWLSAKLKEAPISSSFRSPEQPSSGVEPHSESSSTPPQPTQPDAGSGTTGADPPTPTEKPKDTQSEPAGEKFKPKPVPAKASPTIPLLSPAALPDQRDVAESLQSYSDWLVANGGQALRLHAPPLFPSALALLKPLKPLLIPRFSHYQRRLDEEHSAESSAELGIVWPVFRPGREPGLRVRLVLDAGMSMAVWRPYAEELKRVLASSQSFAEVTLETLPLERLDAAIKQERRLTSPLDGPSITLLISDTAGLHWWDRRIQPWLAAVGAHQPMAVVHPLPYRYRMTTALREGVSVTLSNQRQLASNTNYRKERVLSPDPWAQEEQHPVIWALPEGAVIPVISLNPRETRPWAALVMGDRQARCPGVVISPSAILNSTAPPPPPSMAKPCAKDLLKGFLGVASSEAQMLLSWMAGSPAPLTLGVLRLLQGALRQKGNTAQPLAEVMVSGLLERLPSQEGVKFEEMQFHVIPEVRVLLQKDLDPAAHQTVLHLVTQVLERHWNRRLSGPSFESVITDPSVDTPQNATGLVNVANLTARMLAELPGKQFKDLAQKFHNKQQDLFGKNTLNNEQEMGSMPTNNVYGDMPVSLGRIQTGKQKSGRTGQEINEDRGDSRIEDFASASSVTLPTNDQQTIEFASTIEAILECFTELVKLIVYPIYSAADELHTDSFFRDQHYFNALKAFLPLPDDVRIACIQLVDKYQSQPVSPFRERLFPLLVNPIFHQDFVEYLQVGAIEFGNLVKARMIEKLEALLAPVEITEEQSKFLHHHFFAELDKAFFGDATLSRWRFELSLRFLREQVVEGKRLAEEAAGKYAPERQLAALEAYCRHALLSWDIIDLASLPNDPDIATQRLLLRQLYMPLRIGFEAQQSDRDDQVMLVNLEQQREASRLRDAGRRDARDAHATHALSDPVAIGERLGTGQRFVVLGDPGGGKTTMLRWLATAFLLRHINDPAFDQLPDVQTLPEQNWIPVLIRCREIGDDDLCRSFKDVLKMHLDKSELQPQEAQVMFAVILDRLAKGEVLLLVDGLDEISNLRVREAFCQQLERIAVRYPDAPILVTSRIVGYRDMPDRMRTGFLHGVIGDLQSETKDLFANRWVEATEAHQTKATRDKSATDLIAALHSSDRIERLTSNPMLLTTMALIKRKVGKLPTRRHDFYAEAVRILLYWNPQIYTVIEEEEALPQLAFLAYEMCRRGVQQLLEDEVLNLLDQLRINHPRIRALRKRDSRAFLHLLKERAGLLMRSGVQWQPSHVQANAIWEFRHLAFQEYLASRALLEGLYKDQNEAKTLAEQVALLAAPSGVDPRDADRPRQEFAVSDSWRETLRLLVPNCRYDEVDGVLLSILNPGDEEDVDKSEYPRAVLAAQCLAEEPNVSEETAREVLEKLVSLIGVDDGVMEITTNLERAALEVWQSSWKETLQTCLIEAFSDRNAATKANCGGVLAQLLGSALAGSAAELDSCFEAVVASLESGEREEVICAALTVVQLVHEGSLSRPDALVKALLRLLQRGGSEAHAAAWALAWLSVSRPSGHSERGPIYRNRLLPPVLATQWEGAGGGGWQPTAEQTGVLLEALGRGAATEGEGKRHLIELLGKSAQPSVVFSLLMCVADPDAFVREAARESLAWLATHLPSPLPPAQRDALEEQVAGRLVRNDALAEAERCDGLVVVALFGQERLLLEVLADQGAPMALRRRAAESMGLLSKRCGKADPQAIEQRQRITAKLEGWLRSDALDVRIERVGEPALLAAAREAAQQKVADAVSQAKASGQLKGDRVNQLLEMIRQAEELQAKGELWASGASTGWAEHDARLPLLQGAARGLQLAASADLPLLGSGPGRVVPMLTLEALEEEGSMRIRTAVLEVPVWRLPLPECPGAGPQQLELVLVPAGKYGIGSPPEEAGRDVYTQFRQQCEGVDVEVRRTVRLEGFALLRHPISQAQWRAVVMAAAPELRGALRATPSTFRPKGAWERHGQPGGLPVSSVSWNTCRQWLRALNSWLEKQWPAWLEQHPALGAEAFRLALPSESQWEAACRAGTASPFHFGATLDASWARYDASTTYGKGRRGEGEQRPVSNGAFGLVNRWGLAEMHGQLQEWCADQWHRSPTPPSQEGRQSWFGGKSSQPGVLAGDALEGPDPGLTEVPLEREMRLLRGGSWFDEPLICRSAHRYGLQPAGLYDGVGFRVCCLPPGLPSSIAQPAAKSNPVTSHSTLRLGDRKVRPLQGTPQSPLILLDPDLSTFLGLPPQDVVLYKSATLASINYDKSRLERQYGHKIKVLTPDDLFLPELYLLPGENALVNTWLDKAMQKKLMIAGEAVTILLPMKDIIREIYSSDELSRFCKFNLTTSEEGSELRITISLQLEPNGEPYPLSRVFPIKKENVIDGDLPVIALWPYIRSQSWKHYIIFSEDRSAGLSVDGFADYELHEGHEEQESVKYFSCEQFPDMIKVCERLQDRGLIPVNIPNLSNDIRSGAWRVGMTFGTSVTNYIIDDGSGPARRPLKSFVIPLTLASREYQTNLLHKFFIPETIYPKDRNPPVVTSLNTYGWRELRGEVPEIFHQARVQWPIPGNAKALRGSSIRTSFKWRELQYQRPFLKELALLISCNAVSSGATELEWTVSYPSAFSPNEARNYQRLWRDLCQELTLITGLRHQIPIVGGEGGVQTEAVAFANYFANHLNRQMVHAACIEVGEATTNISIWQDNSLLHQVSVPFAGRDIFADVLQRKPSFILFLFSAQTMQEMTTDEAKLRQDPNFKSWLDNCLRYESDELLLERMPIYRAEQNKQVLEFVSLLAISFGGLYHYLGLILRALAKEGRLRKQVAMPVYMGGYGAQFLNWLDESSTFREGCDADLLMKALQHMSSGFNHSPHVYGSTILSNAFMDELPCGLISTGFKLNGDFDPVDEAMFAGEQLIINGFNFNTLDRVILPQEITTIERFEIASLTELQYFVKNYDEALESSELTAILPIHKLIYLDGLWDEVETEVRAICLERINKEINDLEPEPGFIISLRALCKVLARQWSDKW